MTTDLYWHVRDSIPDIQTDEMIACDKPTFRFFNDRRYLAIKSSYDPLTGFKKTIWRWYPDHVDYQIKSIIQPA